MEDMSALIKHAPQIPACCLRFLFTDLELLTDMLLIACMLDQPLYIHRCIHPAMHASIVAYTQTKP